MSGLETTFENTLRAVPEIKTAILDSLTPAQTRSLMIACRHLFTNKERDRYLSLFKYVIGDWRWFESKIRDGYVFTLLDTGRHEYTLGNTDVQGIRVKIVNVILVVTRSEHFVACTDSFMSSSVIAPGYGDFNILSDTVVRDNEPVTRVVHMVARELTNEITVVIHTPLREQSTDFPMFLGWFEKWYFGKRPIAVRCMIRGTSTLKCGTLNSKGLTSDYTFEDAMMNLFSLLVPNWTANTNMVLRVQR